MGAPSKGQLVAQIASIGARSALDAITRPKATDPQVPPTGSAAVTREWLTGALCGDVAGAEVAAFQLGEIDHGSNARQPISVTYNAAGTAAGLPTRMFGKSTPRFTQRLAGGLTGAAVAETGFYREMRPALGDIESPVGYYGVADARSCRSLLLVEDISDRVRAFGNPAEQYIDREKAEQMVRLLARVHGRFWNDPRLDSDFAWLRTTQEFQDHLNVVTGFSKRFEVGVDRSASFAPAEFVRRKKDIAPALARAMELNVQGPRTLIHFDVHLANWYITHDERMGLMDWGCVVRGQWAIDVAYALLAALTVEDRRAWEKDLLELYLATLEQEGGTPPPFADAWRQYRQQTFHGLTFWLFTIGYGRLQPKMQPDDVCETIVGRMAQAVVDLRSFDALDER